MTRTGRADLERAPSVSLRPDIQAHLHALASGALAPLSGFMTFEETTAVLRTGRLSEGRPWAVPILLPARGRGLPAGGGEPVALRTPDGRLVGAIEVRSAFDLDPGWLARHVLDSDDRRHPGVERLFSLGTRFLGGPVEELEPPERPFGPIEMTPAETRALVGELGWRTVAAFQTRNIPHRGHELLQRLALALVDGLLVQPLLGWKRAGEFSDPAIVTAYQVMLDDFYRADRVLLSGLRLPPLHAGPREVVFQAQVRANFGATHFVVGRDRAGASGANDPDAVRRAFDHYPDLAIQPLVLRGDLHHCRRCGQIVSDRSCPHPEPDRLAFDSGLMRSCVARRQAPPPEVLRPEIWNAVMALPEPLVTRPGGSGPGGELQEVS